MSEKTLSVNEVAKLAGITTRTLHYYDEIGLLKPSIVNDANKYRLYTKSDLNRLQEILFFREVGFPLKEVKEMINAPRYSRDEALKKHLQILEAQRERLGEVIELVNKELAGERDYSFSAFSNSKILDLQSEFKEEIIQRWGETESYKEYEERFAKISNKKKQYDIFAAKAQEIFEKLAEHELNDPASKDIQDIVKEWQEYISENFYMCDNQMLKNLGEMYVNDKRFSDYINGFGSDNLAEFFNKAIIIYCLSED